MMEGSNKVNQNVEYLSQDANLSSSILDIKAEMMVESKKVDLEFNKRRLLIKGVKKSVQDLVNRVEPVIA
jgi:hypothetical protein